MSNQDGNVPNEALQHIMGKMSGLSNMIPKMPEMPEIHNPFHENLDANMASEFYNRLVEWINEFDKGLDQAHEVGVRLVSFGQTVVFHLEDMGYWNPSLISFNGKMEDGQPVELIQHVSQISILLTTLPRKNPNEPKTPIGFTTSSEEENSCT